MSDPIDYSELEKRYERIGYDQLSKQARCGHEDASVTQDGNAITVHCGHCGLYGVMDVRTAERLGWVE